MTTEPNRTRGASRTLLTHDTTRYARLVGENVAIRRAHLGLTQGQLAEQMTNRGFPMTAGIVFFTERGTHGTKASPKPRKVSVDQLVAFADIFGCEPAHLLQPACGSCQGFPPDGFTCNSCGVGASPTPPERPAGDPR